MANVSRFVGRTKARGWSQVLLLLCALATPPAGATLGDVIGRPARMLVEPEQAALLDVARAGSRLVAVGARGVVLLSDDEGAHWRQTPVPTSATLTRVRFVSPKVGWAVGHFGVVLRSEDGGESWTRQLDGRAAAQTVLSYYQKQAEPDPAATAALAPQVEAAQRLVDDGPDKPFLDLWFEDEQRGFVVGAYNLIFRTEDGGRTWTPWQARVDNPRALHLYAILPVGTDWYIAGEQGLLLRSTDGGQSFSRLASPYEGSFFGLVADAQNTLVAFGLRGHVFRSTDRGASWQPVPLPSPASVVAAAVPGDGTLLLTNQVGQVFISRDRGATVQTVPGVPPSAYTALIVGTDRALVLTGLRGVVRVAAPGVAAVKQE
jgi:photosystem II stability/assembly factor-like uncharacterized protein